MSTAQATLNRFQTSKVTAENDRTRRFGYNPCGISMTMPISGSGLDCNPIDNGRLLLFVPKTSYHRGAFNAMARTEDGRGLGTYPRIATERFPAEFSRAVEMKFRTGNSGDFGYRNLPMLTPLHYEVTADRYVDDADLYFNVVHPALTCEFGLEKLISRAPHDPVYQACPTCRLADLKSEACANRIYTASEHLDSAVLDDLRNALIESVEAGLLYVSTKVDELNADIQKRLAGESQGRTTRNEADFLYLKMMHRKPPTEQNIDQMERFADAVAKGISRGNAQPSTAMDDAEYAEFLAFKEFKRQKDARAIIESEIPQDVTVEVADNGGFATGQSVLCDGEPGTISEQPNAQGWFTVTLESGEVRKVRKDKLVVN